MLNRYLRFPWCWNISILLTSASKKKPSLNFPASNSRTARPPWHSANPPAIQLKRHHCGLPPRELTYPNLPTLGKETHLQNWLWRSELNWPEKNYRTWKSHQNFFVSRSDGVIWTLPEKKNISFLGGWITRLKNVRKSNWIQCPQGLG